MHHRTLDDVPPGERNLRMRAGLAHASLHVVSVAQEDAFTVCGAANLRLVRLDAVEKECLRPIFEHILREALPVFVCIKQTL